MKVSGTSSVNGAAGTGEQANPDKLYVELVALRRGGLRPKLPKQLVVPELRRIAAAVCPEITQDADRIRDTLRLAVERISGGAYGEAIADLWGVKDTFGVKSTKRRETAIARLETTEENFNRRIQPEMTEALASALRTLLAETEANYKTVNAGGGFQHPYHSTN